MSRPVAWSDGRRPVGAWPVTPAFLVGLVVMLGLVIAVIEVRAVGYAYGRLGIGPRWAYALLLGSIIGGAVNVPIARFPVEVLVEERVVGPGGRRFRVPRAVEIGESILAVNVGGALIPSGLAVYMFVRVGLGWRAVAAVLVVSVVMNRAARPVPGVGVVVPTLLPAAVAVLTAALLGGASQPALAYVGGTLGTLLGADVARIPEVKRWGAPLLSIGGAGTFDGIFVTGVIAVLLAAG